MTPESWERIENLFHQALELPRADRARFLDEACAGDPTIRREVDLLLASDTGPTLKMGNAMGAAAEALLSEDALVGQRLGVYRVLRSIGRGGMGSVFLAVRDDNQFDKEVAIKIVKRGMDTEEVLFRFGAERQILANLDHPYIARLLDAGVTSDGRPFFVMEYIDGEPVHHYCRNRSLPLRERCELLRKICDAVAYAHHNLVIHRDLKPANILVTADGTPKLLDFGVAKLLTTEGAPEVTATIITQRPFTPNYASPEQVRGERVTTATDTYSLGVVAYEVLSGTRAYELDSTNPAEIERLVCDTGIQPPSERAEPQFRAALSGDLDNIILKAMHKDPSRRYSSIEQLSDDIDRYLDGYPVLARPDSLPYIAGKFVRRNKLPLAAAAIALLGIIGGAAVAWKKAVEAHAARQIAEERQAQMLDLANRALIDVNTAIWDLPGSLEARRKIVQTTLAFLQQLAGGSAIDDRLRAALFTAYSKTADLQGLSVMPNLGDTAGALDSYKKAEALLLPVVATTTDFTLLLRLMSMYNHYSSTLRLAGNTKEALQAAERSKAVSSRLLVMRPNDREALSEIAMMSRVTARALPAERVTEALEYAHSALDTQRRLAEQDPKSIPLRHGLSDAEAATAQLLHNLFRVREAAEYRRRAVVLREQIVRELPDNLEYGRSLMIAYNNLAEALGTPIHGNLGKTEEARELAHKVAAIARKMAAADPQNSLARTDLAFAEIRLASLLDRPAEAEVMLRRNAAWLEAETVRNPRNRIYGWNLAIAYLHLGAQLERQNRPADAIAFYDKAIDAAQRNAASRGMDLLGMRAEAALIALQARKGNDDAIARAKRLVDKASSSAVASTAYADVQRARLGFVRATLADALAVRAQCDQAVPVARQAAEEFSGLGELATLSPFAEKLQRARAIANGCAK